MTLSPTVKSKYVLWVLAVMTLMCLLFTLVQVIPLGLPPILFVLSLLCIPCGILWGFLGLLRQRAWGWFGPLLTVLGVLSSGALIVYDINLESLHKAASHDNDEWLRNQLDWSHQGPDIVDLAGDSLLMFAADKGCDRTVAELLRRGARTDYIDRDKDTALSVATRHHHSEIVRMLRAAGARR